MLTKCCTTCGHQKLATPEFFYRHSDNRDGLQGICKDCKNRRDSKVRSANPLRMAKQREHARQWRLRKGHQPRKPRELGDPARKPLTGDRLMRKREYDRLYIRRPEGKAARKLSQRAYYLRNRLKKNFASFVRQSLRAGRTGARWETLVGYTVEELRSHLQRQFTGKMSWANYGSHWEVDHIRPVASFKIENPQCADFKACWALSNLRPLSRKENREKRAKITHLL